MPLLQVVGLWMHPFCLGFDMVNMHTGWFLMVVNLISTQQLGIKIKNRVIYLFGWDANFGSNWLPNIHIKQNHLVLHSDAPCFITTMMLQGLTMMCRYLFETISRSILFQTSTFKVKTKEAKKLQIAIMIKWTKNKKHLMLDRKE